MEKKEIHYSLIINLEQEGGPPELRSDATVGISSPTPLVLDLRWQHAGGSGHELKAALPWHGLQTKEFPNTKFGAPAGLRWLHSWGRTKR